MDLSSIAITAGRIPQADSGGKNVGNLYGCPVQWFMLHLTHRIKAFSVGNEIYYRLNTGDK